MPDSSQFIATSNNTVNIEINSEHDRITKFKRRYDMLNDNFYQQAVTELGNVYTKAKELGLISQIDDTNNLYRIVMEEITKVYENGITRTFSDNDAIQEDMTMLYDDLDINEIMAQSNLYLNAFNDVLIQVGTSDGELSVKLRRPDNTIVVTDDNLEIEEVYIYLSEEGGLQTWYGYTAEEMFSVKVARADDIFKDDTIRNPMEGEDTTINPLGFIPFIALHGGFRDDSFWQSYKGDDIVKGTIQIAIKLTFLNHLIKLQSFKQLVGSGSNISQMNGVVMDPQTILFLSGEDAKIETLDLEANYKALWETIQSINNNIAVNYKISPNTFRLTGAPASGFSLMMENVKLDKFVRKQQKQYTKYEDDLFDLLKRVDEKAGIGMIKADKISASFPPISYPKSEKEIIENQEKEIELGLSNQIDIIKKRDKVDEDVAEETYIRNLEIRNRAAVKFAPAAPTVTLPLDEGI